MIIFTSVKKYLPAVHCIPYHNINPEVMSNIDFGQHRDASFILQRLAKTKLDASVNSSIVPANPNITPELLLIYTKSVLLTYR